MKQSKQLKYVKLYKKGESVESICNKYGIKRSTFYLWIHKYSDSITDVERLDMGEFYKMKAHVKKLELMIEVLQKVECHSGSPTKDKMVQLEKLKNSYSTNVLCEALKVNRTTFNNFILCHHKQAQKKEEYQTMLSKNIIDIYEKSSQNYGARRIKVELEELDIKVSAERVTKVMKELGIESMRGGSKKEYLKQLAREKKNLIIDKPKPIAPNLVWASDVTYIKYKELFYYLCVIQDQYSRKIIAHHISTVHSTQLITTTFHKANRTREISDQLIFHSDRGTQYTSKTFRDLLRKHGIEQSFSKPYNPYNNSTVESFFSTLKKEEIYRKKYNSEKQLLESVKLFIEFYNCKRKHSSLGYKSPNFIEENYYESITDEI